jgi:hypothetical protein
MMNFMAINGAPRKKKYSKRIGSQCTTLGVIVQASIIKLGPKKQRKSPKITQNAQSWPNFTIYSWPYIDLDIE